MRSKHTHRPGEKPRETLSQMARRLDPEPGHCFQVRKNAEQLFGSLAALHGLGEAAWALLEAAALLHDIGHRRGFQGHHKHSRDMILEQDWPGLDARGRLIVACVARYHRKSGPKPGHKHYRSLGEADQALVCRLAALLRIADGLDRAHRASVRAIAAEIGDESVTLRVTQRGASPVDIAGALRKADLFELVYGRALHIAVDVSTGPDPL